MKPLVSIIPERAPHVEKRKKLTRNQVAQLMLDQKGLCGCGCGQKLQPLTEGFVDEHVIPLAAGGTNALSNRRLLKPDCAKAKTKTDQEPIKKGRHMAGGKGSQRAKRERERAEGRHKEIQGRPTIPKRHDPWGKAYRERKEREAEQ